LYFFFYLFSIEITAQIEFLLASNLPETNNQSIDEKMEVDIINDTIFIDELNTPTSKKIKKKLKKKKPFFFKII
jgi:hypothetical protein